ncbi:MAG: hypothetical protein ACTSUE_16730 [Promethearchaeota archaeon]
MKGRRGRKKMRRKGIDKRFASKPKKDRTIYILTYSSRGKQMKVNTPILYKCMGKCTECITQSNDIHVVLGIEVFGKEQLMCYEVCYSERVQKGLKSLKFYDKENINFNVTEEEYRLLTTFLDKHVNKTSFNSIGFFWNFCPILSLCPQRGDGFFCVQLIAEALSHAKIIKLDGKVKTSGYVDTSFWSCLCCCCGFLCPTMEGKKPKLIPIPHSYQITATALKDILKQQRSIQRLPEGENPNKFALHAEMERQQQHKRGDGKRSRFFYIPQFHQMKTGERSDQEWVRKEDEEEEEDDDNDEEEMFLGYGGGRSYVFGGPKNDA